MVMWVPQFMLVIELRMVLIFWARSLMFSKHIRFFGFRTWSHSLVFLGSVLGATPNCILFKNMRPIKISNRIRVG